MMMRELNDYFEAVEDICESFREVGLKEPTPEELELLLEDYFESDPDPVNQPEHYTSHPSGIECIEICEHMNFLEGNAIKYIWRASLKGKRREDLRKAQYYINRLVNNEEMYLDE